MPPAPITAVIINYNYARFVGDAVRACLTQSMPFQQVIVVNDGSTDDSLSVLGGFDGIEVLDIDNRGQTGASRVGLSQATAPYVYFLDADDYPEARMSQVVSGFCDGRNVKIQFQLRGVDEAGRDLRSVFPTFPFGYTSDGMRQDNQRRGFHVCPPSSGNVYLRSALEALDLTIVDQYDALDGAVALVMPEIGPVATISEPLACYRVHGGSTSQYAVPTSEIMQRDLVRHRRRWQEAVRLTPGLCVPPPDTTEYEWELHFLSEALGDGRPRPATTWQYASHLVTSRERPRRKALLVAWVVAVALAPARRRRAMVAARRSSANRSGPLNAFLDAVLGGRNRGQ
ncbi:MAG: glycosyltransferase family 2 protein [Candidatus Nanopelagicales bacterium]